MSTSNKITRGLPNLVLQEERLAQGWTQQEVANRVGTTVVNVSRWERGVTSPNPYFRQKLCTLFAKEAEALGLLPMKQVPQSETTLISAEITPDLPEKKLVTPPNEIASLSLRKRLLGKRRTVLAVISIVPVILASESVFLVYSLLTSTHIDKVIARDTFQRANQSFWGTASDGLQWEEDANILKNFSIINKAAQITTTKDGSNYNAILGPRVSNAEVLFSGSLSDFNNSNLGAVLRWKDSNNWYKTYIDGTDLVIQKKVNDGVPTYLGRALFSVNPGELYTIRFRVVGTSLLAKAWPARSSEPGDWMVTTNDNSFTTGFCGLRIRILNGSIAKVTSFLATADS